MVTADQPAMTGAARSCVFVLLYGAVLTLWAPGRWPLGIFQAAIFLLTIFVILQATLRRSRIYGSRLSIPIAGMIAIGALQLAAGRTSYAWATRISLLSWLANLCILFLTPQLFRDRTTQRRVLHSLFYFGFGVSILAVAQMATAKGRIFWLFPSGYPESVMGPFVSRNLYAAFTELLLPIGLTCAVAGRRAWMHAAMCGIMFASVVAGASRAGLLLLSAEVVTVLLLARFRGLLSGRGVAAAAAKFALPCVVCIALFGGAALWYRLQMADPYGGRREMLRSSIEMASERPWSGFGLGTWAEIYPAFAYFDDGTVPAHAHNDWVEWLVEGGVPGLALMLWLAAMTVRPARRSLWGVGILAVWVHCLVDSPLPSPVLAAWFFLLAALQDIGAAQAHSRSATVDTGAPGAAQSGNRN